MSYRDDMNPRAWGPPAWKFLDSVALGYPEVAMMPEPAAGLKAIAPHNEAHQ